jgi:hypothetical protein
MKNILHQKFFLRNDFGLTIFDAEKMKNILHQKLFFCIKNSSVKIITKKEFLMQKNEKYSASKILFLHQKFFPLRKIVDSIDETSIVLWL